MTNILTWVAYWLYITTAQQDACIYHSCHCTSRPMTTCMCINRSCDTEFLSPVEKHNKLHDMSDSNGHFQKIMSISINSHLKRQQICSIYHINNDICLGFNRFQFIRFALYIFLEKFLLPATTLWLVERSIDSQSITVSVGILVVCLSCDFISS